MNSRRGAFGFLAFAVLQVGPVSAALAQRASENATIAAQDVFGTTVGNESIGIYNPGNVRGFSPLQAGNVRIDGLYFDMVGDQNDRIEEASTIRVGLAAEGYAFPAPSGIVDYALREPGDATDLSIFQDANSWGAETLQLDGTVPVDDKLSIGGGIGYYRNVFPSGANGYQGTYGGLARWHPLPHLEILPFWSRKDTYVQKHSERYEPNGDFLPSPMPERHFFGPPWVKSTDYSVTYGTLVRYTFSSWVARLGIFRSEKAVPESNWPFLVNLAANGQGDLTIESSPASHLGSTSGEFRLEKTFTKGSWVQKLLFSLRGRNWNGRYGNALDLNVGPQLINQWATTPEPGFQFGPLIHDHVDERWIGAQYQVAWKNRLQISVGIQKARYHKQTIAPGNAPSVINTSPWLITSSVVGSVTDTVSLFSDYTQGLEDNGIAPTNAANSNQALPATTAHQAEGGVRWHFMPAANFVATLFEMQKPYFDLDPSGTYRELGGLENKGLELSLSGNLTNGIDVIAGGVLAQPTVNGDVVRLGISGGRPVGIYSRKFVLGTNWRPPSADHTSFDLDYNYYGSVPATLNNAVSIPAFQTLDWDTRYQFKMAGQNTSLKFAVFDIFNARSFSMIDSGTFGFFGGRTLDLRLIMDLT